MLRALAFVLLVVNLVILSWTQGWLVGVIGRGPDTDREPQRLQNQVNAPAIQVMDPAALARLQSRTVCLEAGPYSQAEMAQIDTLARSALPEGSWTLLSRERAGSWAVYMGRYTAPESLARKSAELRRLGVAFEELRSGDHAPGLMLGRFGRVEEAQEALRRLAEKKVRSARVLQLAAPVTSFHLRIPRADANLQASADSLKGNLLGRRFASCDAAK
ncbi:MAG: hypothetical protein RL722_366 [Pseudomonadota bacterium]|jgi:hypothetical protein